MNLDGAVCVVSGASSGIGRALAGRLAAHGARVWAIGRNEDRLRALVEESAPGKIEVLVADLTRDDDIDAAVRQILSRDNRVAVLAHAAGLHAFGSIESIAPSDVDRQCRVNLVAPVLLTRLLLPAVRLQRGQIVFVNSLAAHRANANNAVYAATKAGLKVLADGLRAEVNAAGVRVVTVHAGRTASPMQEEIHRLERRPYRPEFLLEPDDVVNVVLSALTLSERGELTDLNVRPMAELPPR